MKFRVTKSNINGTIEIPGSKSHTIRSLFFASLANGISKIKKPLISEDAISALNTCKTFGTRVTEDADTYIVEGFGGIPNVPDDVVNVGNSGTTLNIALSTAALIDGYTVFTGDHQIRNRPIGPLANALSNLGALVTCTRQNDKPPVIIKGKAKGGITELDGVSSQFLTSLLINAPLFEKETTIKMSRLYEIPYVDITLWWLDRLGIKYENNNYKTVSILPNQSYRSFEQIIPADFSSATFFLVLAAINGGKIELKNLDMTDPQGDKLVVSILEDMGAKIEIKKNSIAIEGKNLKGREVDMNSIPDALPAMAVAACFAEGETKLVNVAHARLKETDRIKVMYEELGKMGAKIKEVEDGLIISKSDLKPTAVKGHHDHRVVMALAVAGLNINGETIIDTAEAASVTFPDFPDLIKLCGGKIESL